MLVILSDLHFMDATAGCHNLSSDAFEDVFVDLIAGLIADPDKNIREVEVLLLGDVFDFIRTQHWFDVDPENRPWSVNGLSDIGLERPCSLTGKACLDILGNFSETPPPEPLPRRNNTIVEQNWETFDLFRNLEERLNRRGEERLKAKLAECMECKGAQSSPRWQPVKVRLLYLPGNHDRLVRVYPTLRATVCKVLGISPIGPRVTHFKRKEYGVYAEHGHEHDRWNFGGLGDPKRPYLQASVGDIITTEIIAKIPYKLEKILIEKSLEEEDKDLTEQEKDMINRLKDIDNVRPASKAISWIHYKVKKSELPRLKKSLKDAEKIVVEELNAKVPEFAPALAYALCPGLRKSKICSFLLRKLAQLILLVIPSSLLARETVLRRFLELGESGKAPDADNLAESANKRIKGKNSGWIRNVVYGHTHFPAQVLLHVDDNREAYYINSGTWRPCVHKGVEFGEDPDFGMLRHLTCNFFYKSSEDNGNKKPCTKSFETWSGVKRKDYVCDD